MKKICMLAGAIMALSAPIASAASPGLDIGWATNATNGCPADPANIPDVSDPCNDNAAEPYHFAMSFNAPAGITKWVAEEFDLRVQTSAYSLPDWWNLEEPVPSQGIPAGCRYGSFGFTSQRGLGNTVVCKDYWGVNPQNGSMTWIPGLRGRSWITLHGVIARATSTATAITAGVDYYVGSGTIDTYHAVADVGVQPCTGCGCGAVLVFEWLRLDQPAGTPGGDIAILGQHNRNYMTWQGGVNTGCPAGTPARKATWGQVKSLYR